MCARVYKLKSRTVSWGFLARAWKKHFVGQVCWKRNIEMPSFGPEMDALSSTSAVLWWWERSYIYWTGMLSFQCIVKSLNSVSSYYKMYEVLLEVWLLKISLHFWNEKWRIIFEMKPEIFFPPYLERASKALFLLCICSLFYFHICLFFWVAVPFYVGWDAGSTKRWSKKCDAFMYDCWHTCYSCHWG